MPSSEQNAGALTTAAMGKRGVQKRLLAAVFGHLIAAGAWWWGMPHGFPAGHPRWWANSVLPVLVAAGCAAALGRCIARRRVDLPELGIVSSGLAAMWISASAAVAILFTQSGTRPALVCGAIGVCGAFLASRAFVPRTPGFLVGGAICAGMAIGAAQVLSQLAPPAATHPLNLAPPPPPGAAPRATPEGAAAAPEREHAEELARLARDAIRIGRNATLDRETGELTLDSGPLRISCDPVLRFQSRSPDRFWTLFANRGDREGPALRRVELEFTEHGVRAAFESDYRTMLLATAHDPLVEIETSSTLHEPIFSHLNTFCMLVVMGHHRLALAFSPCPAARVEVLPADYPAGRPVRAAWLAADGMFRVVEARDAEKGPFKILGEGPLPREAPLSIDFFDEDRPIARVTLADWAAQADTSLSPTAGWGAPANAIQFQREGEQPTEAGYIFVTLAGTSLGRGWDSVGHAAGIYRNRISFEPIETSK